ncbi:hypothetical protein F441_04836 [Phytophthora nicotianae CJ01A1]|uniref:Uncharacterized protein n=4 Tax=Phytophthora nicotianae TaxID=4792 RepID=V9FMB0_PHYNI|nr:hypothetical protein F443_04839 [Phytophthora nicotianae P1569]ETK91782.1 hypothetical protein L915_04710 [Phytophthora nicotianae]ETO80684.1 hypothetical protein F444_04879 [Phytophthora nicotianae P1976]ETP21705.1 hypothetical protein F441_04836 [Phytophthora nicotianae CJ01A1]ETL45174.1 hypothetical protein L916_04670 [Phytophthora nicotianae]
MGALLQRARNLQHGGVQYMAASTLSQQSQPMHRHLWKAPI